MDTLDIAVSEVAGSLTVDQSTDTLTLATGADAELVIDTGDEQVSVTSSADQVVLIDGVAAMSLQVAPPAAAQLTLEGGPPGPPGPQGEPGISTGISPFTWRQDLPATLWQVAHNLNGFPQVTVVDSAGQLVFGDVDYVDQNNLNIAFGAAFSGVAYLL